CILKEYFRTARRYIKKFNIEAAGARGCWSVDDYLLLPYILGSAENFSSLANFESTHKGLFREAYDSAQVNAMLSGICKLEWPSINIGLIKMYDKEVLGKKVVTQHFIYSDALPDTTNELKH
ncbi:serine/threonine-protein phosphatase 2A activator, partial [Enteropsectra breve]